MHQAWFIKASVRNIRCIQEILNSRVLEYTQQTYTKSSRSGLTLKGTISSIPQGVYKQVIYTLIVKIVVYTQLFHASSTNALVNAEITYTSRSNELINDQTINTAL